MARAQDSSQAPGGGETQSHRHGSGRHAAHVAHEGEPPAMGQLPDSQSSLPASRWPAVLLTIYCIAIIGASLVGGWLPNFVELSHNRMQAVISLIGGLMLGIGVFHMLPHALVELGEDGPDLAAYGMMAGLVIMFLLLRLFHFHHHGPTEVPCAHELTSDSHVHPHPPGEGHYHPHVHERSAVSPAGRNLSWVGVFLGMTLHTLIDGLALGASVAADALHGPMGLLGLGTFLAVWLHKPLDAVSITSVMAVGGWSRTSRTVVNAGFSLICPAGAALFMLGIGKFSNQSTIVGCALAFSAGVFLCIALSDLLPEMEFHSHNRMQLTAALLAGVALAWGIGFLEPAHAHSHGQGAARHSHAE